MNLQNIFPEVKWKAFKRGRKTLSSLLPVHVGAQLAGAELSREFICSHGNPSKFSREERGNSKENMPRACVVMQKITSDHRALLAAHCSVSGRQPQKFNTGQLRDFQLKTAAATTTIKNTSTRVFFVLFCFFYKESYKHQHQHVDRLVGNAESIFSVISQND